MASKVTAQVLGGSPRVLDDVFSVADVKEEMGVPNHTATVNGEPADDDEGLDDYSFVNLAPAVKGGC